MELIRVKNTEDIGRCAGGIIAEAVIAKPDLVLGLATGSTSLPVYRELIRRYEAGELDFSHVRTVNLDEYLGLPGTHEQSYRYFMDENFFKHVNIDPANTHLPDGIAENPEAECARYDALIDGFGGIDLQLLGIGYNGHIAFIEPSDYFPKSTQIFRLDEVTINANARFFTDPSEVPRFAFTMGARHIMLARKIIMLAGPEKTQIVDRAMNGKITPQVPASILQLHRDATIILAQE
jgi:glucosamine-6-phosphate deaminase